MKKSLCLGLLFFTPHIIWGVNIEYTHLTSQFIPIENLSHQKSYYQLSSKLSIKKYMLKNNKLFFLNRKKYMLNNNYYLNGKFSTPHTHLNYKKAYVLGGKVYLFNVNGEISSYKVKAKELVYDGYKTYTLKRCEVHKKSKIYRRNKYILQE